MAVRPYVTSLSDRPLGFKIVLPSVAVIVSLVSACAGSPLPPPAGALPTSTSKLSPPTGTTVPLETAPAAATPFESFGDDITRGLPPGNPERGEVLFGPQGEFCTGCHSQLMIGPPITAYQGHPAIADRAAATIADPSYSGQASNVAEYLIESIVRPSAHVVAGFPDGNMPNNFGLLLSPQDISDLVAYMLVAE